jgi:protein-tyrosine phosphatase
MYTDIHCHILPFLDDGSKDWDETETLLLQAEDQGISRIICTTHSRPQWKPFPLQKYLQTLADANQLCKSMRIPITLLPGCEIMYADEITERHLQEGRMPTLAGSNYVLVEFMPDEKLSRIQSAVNRLSSAGYRPILAHIERYEHLARSPQSIPEMREQGARMQVNYGTFMRSVGFMGNRFLKYLIKYNLIDFLGTDAHDASIRKINRTDGIAAIQKKYGSDTAVKLEALAKVKLF